LPTRFWSAQARRNHSRRLRREWYDPDRSRKGRRGYGIEIDCHYTDTIRRFAEVYGLKAVHAESNLDLERLTNERFKEKGHGQKAKNGKGHRAKNR
jgi:hypothetical protein